VYACKGSDSHEADYTGTATLDLVAAQSLAKYCADSFKLEVPEFGIYLGQAAANRQRMAMHFPLIDTSTKDFGTGNATFKKNKSGKWTFSKYYYKPEFKGGNFATETCVQR